LKSIRNPVEISMKYQWKSIGNQVEILMKYQWKSVGISNLEIQLKFNQNSNELPMEIH
jgi:hypothetical protein